MKKIGKLGKLGKLLNVGEQRSVNGGSQRSGCNIILCTADSEGCPCYGNFNSADGRGVCMDGMCCD